MLQRLDVKNRQDPDVPGTLYLTGYVGDSVSIAGSVASAVTALPLQPRYRDGSARPSASSSLANRDVGPIVTVCVFEPAVLDDGPISPIVAGSIVQV